MTLETELFIALVVFGIIDVIIPLPLLACLLIYVLFQKPAWFLRQVTDIYASRKNRNRDSDSEA